MEFNFTDKFVVVTGATRGIGAAIANCFNRVGAKLLLTGTDIELINALNKENERKGITNIQYMAVDFTQRKSLSSFLDALKKEKKIDVCVNNAGINRINELEKVTDEEFDSVTEVNFRAPYLICQAVASKMKKQNYGRIVNVASIWSEITKEHRSIYTASKFGLVGMTKTIAIELAPYNVLVNAISPGFIQTELTNKTLSQEEQEQLASMVPIKRFGEPEEIAKIILFLASDLNTYITGQNIIADGGYVSV